LPTDVSVRFNLPVLQDTSVEKKHELWKARAEKAILLAKQRHPSSALHCLFPQRCTDEVLVIAEETSQGLKPGDLDILKARLARFKRLAVVSVYGTQGCGKSTLSNIFCKRSLFTEGHGETETRGILAVVLPHPQHSDSAVLLLDTAGTNVNKHLTIDILGMALLSSSLCLFNINGTLDSWAESIQTSLEKLDVVFSAMANGDQRSTASIANSVIVVQRNRQPHYKVDFTNEWNTKMATLPLIIQHVRDTLTVPLPDLKPSQEDANTYPNFWKYSSNSFQAHILRIACKVGLQLPDIVTFDFATPDRLIPTWQRIIEGFKNTAYQQALGASYKDLFKASYAFPRLYLSLPA